MAKYKFLTKSLDPNDHEIYETIVECDAIQLDQTGKFFYCARHGKVSAIMKGTGQEVPIATVMRIFNSEYVIEIMLEESRVMQMLEN